MSKERDCRECVFSNFHGDDNGCTQWECEFIPRSEAIEAWRELHKEQDDELYTLTEEEYESLTPMQKYWCDKSIEDAVKGLKFAEHLQTLAEHKEEDGETVKIKNFAPLDNTDCSWK